MTNQDHAIGGAENHAWLLDEFAGLLVRQEPELVLDVGCGGGLLLRRCRENSIPAVGVDLGGERLDALLSEGFEVREGSAYDLPFEDGKVDWTVLRHVPHHLEDPATAICEALRVSRSGILVAEPYFDPSIPSQRVAFAVDAWEKRQHRRGGMFHVAPLDFDALLACLPPDWECAFGAEMHVSLRLRDRSVEEFEREAEELVADLEPGHAEREGLREVREEIERFGLTWNGSATLLLRRL
ncbi:MAG TPA: class I SAM-dependent methyltransferase [Planctomycetes bacterium]|nr:class I SAM-dependent methyltransferase [Planctomycetota bacterium]